MDQTHLPIDTSALIRSVQHNCDVADAHYAGHETLCIYLLKMRDYYRWAEQVPLDRPVDRHVLGDWISAKESRWDAVQEQAVDYVPIPLGEKAVDRFDSESINQVINPLGLVYGGGLGRQARPLFFLGKLMSVEKTDRFRILVCGEELARTFSAPPAMSHSDSVYIRRDALQRYLAGLVEDWHWKKQDNAMGQIIADYAFDADPASALERFVDNEMENLILHEIGERVAGELIGQGWQSMVYRIDNPVVELKVRAVRDNLADCLSLLPACLSLGDQASLDFFYANMTPLRKQLFPSFCNAYQAAKRQGNHQPISKVVREGQTHWLSTSQQLISKAASDASPMRYIKHIECTLDNCVL